MMSKSATVTFLGVVSDADIYGRSGVAVRDALVQQ
jgi:hypothetical protein